MGDNIGVLTTGVLGAAPNISKTTIFKLLSREQQRTVRTHAHTNQVFQTLSVSTCLSVWAVRCVVCECNLFTVTIWGDRAIFELETSHG